MHRRSNGRVIAGACLAVLVAMLVACGGGPGTGTFQLELAPGEVGVVPGLEATVEVVAARSGGFAAPIALSLSDTPEGVTASFDPNPTTTGQSTLVLSAALHASQGEHVLDVRGEGGGASVDVTLSVVVTEPLPLSSIEVDPAVDDDAPTLPPLEDGVPRPVTGLTDDSGVPSHFVTNELLLMSDDMSQVDDLIARYGGTLLATVDAAAGALGAASAVGASDTAASMHLIRIETTPADEAELLEDLRRLEPGARSDLVVGSAAGLDLLAAVAHEAAAGAVVAPNWVATFDGFSSGVSMEAPVIDGSDSRYTSANVFDWEHMGADALGIGVAQSWWALESTGKLDGTLRIAILDAGFQDNADLPPGWEAVSWVAGDSPIGSPNPGSCGDNPCPWHGTYVTWAAAAVPDNDFGTAGPAGPIAEVIMIHTGVDLFSATHALFDAVGRGADIVNMSFRTRVPSSVAWSVLPFEKVTATIRTSGVLLFASAGNQGEDVDAIGCYPVFMGVFFKEECWELAWHTPCENSGVICVGGIGRQTPGKAGNSNYGLNDVDIFAPYWVFAPADATNPGNGLIDLVAGTSYSSPFTAGIAALIWAADRSQSAGQVASALLSNAHASPDPLVPRYVNAFGAVRSVLGGVPPSVTIIEPVGDVTASPFIAFSATVDDLEDGPDCCVPTWHSDLDGYLGTGTSIVQGLSVGTHQITASATDSDGNTGSDVVTVTAINVPPEVTITTPTPGATLESGMFWTFIAEVYDVNELGFDCTDANVAWTSDHPDDPVLTGCTPNVSFGSLGPRTWTVAATDAGGATGSASVSIDVVAGPEMWASIIEPVPGAWYFPGTDAVLSARVSDAFELPATFEWGASIDGVSYDVVATGDLVAGRLGDPVVPQRTWTVPESLADEHVYVRFTISAANGEVTTVIAEPIEISAIPH